MTVLERANYSQQVLMSVAPHSRGRRVHFASTLAVTLAVLAVAPSLVASATNTLVPRQAPLPGDASNVPQAILNAVVCMTATECVAVGRYESAAGGQALILTKSAGVWGAPHTIALPANALAYANGVLNGLDCTSIGNCVAVGQYEKSGSYEAMIVTEHSGVWGTAIQSPLPGGSRSTTVTALNAVSCTTSSNCIAVGQFKNAGGDQGFIIHDIAGSWGHALVAPLPKYAKSNFITQLDGVSCTSTGNCVAVGQYVNTTPSRQAMILTETAGTWQHGVPAPLPSDAHLDPWAGLFGVTCVSRGYCVAVGVYEGAHGGQGLISVEAGGNWRQGIMAPLPTGNSPGSKSDQLLGVTCTSFGFCHAVGQFTDGAIDQGVLMTENNGHWSNGELVPRPSNAINPVYAGLNGISCTTTTSCEMVGQYQSSLGEPALIVSK